MTDCWLLTSSWKYFRHIQDKTNINNYLIIDGSSVMGQQFLTVTKKGMRVGTIYFIFCRGVSLLFFKTTEGVFYVQGLWHSPNKSPPYGPQPCFLYYNLASPYLPSVDCTKSALSHVSQACHFTCVSHMCGLYHQNTLFLTNFYSNLKTYVKHACYYMPVT